jgi:hypothetical protein
MLTTGDPHRLVAESKNHKIQNFLWRGETEKG